jgi:hypothetical protein
MNIIEDLKWTTTTGEYIKKETPRIRAIPYEVDQNDIINTISNWGKEVNTGGTEYYDKLHGKAKKKDPWVFPFFGDTVRSFQNSWGDQYVGSTNGSQAFGAAYAQEAKGFMDSLAATKGQLHAMGAGKPGALIEPPKYYQYGVDESGLNFDYYLINTDDSPDEDNPSWKKNYESIKELIVLNRFKRENTNTNATPPHLWQVWVGGYRHIRWASMSIDVEMLGMRLMKEDKIIPEGYRIQVNLESLYTEPSNFADDYDNPNS